MALFLNRVMRGCCNLCAKTKSGFSPWCEPSNLGADFSACLVISSVQCNTTARTGIGGLVKNIWCGVQFNILEYSSASPSEIPMSPDLWRDSVAGWMPLSSATMLFLRPLRRIILSKLFGATGSAFTFSYIFIVSPCRKQSNIQYS